MSEFKENLQKIYEIEHPKPEPKITLKSVFKLGRKAKDKYKKKPNKNKK